MSMKQVFHIHCDRCPTELAHNCNSTPPGWRLLEYVLPRALGGSARKLHLCEKCTGAFDTFLQGGFVADARPGTIIPVKGDPIDYL